MVRVLVLRDAYHVGLKYSLDLKHFIKNFAILGVGKSPLERCRLGLKDTLQATVTADMFVVIWKSMYDLVYHVENYRIAEKMLEKSILLRCEDDRDYRDRFNNMEKFIETDDERLLDELMSGSGRSARLADSIKMNHLYRKIHDISLPQESHRFDEFVARIQTKPDKFSDELSISLCNEVLLRTRL